MNNIYLATSITRSLYPCASTHSRVRYITPSMFSLSRIFFPFVDDRLIQTGYAPYKGIDTDIRLRGLRFVTKISRREQFSSFSRRDYCCDFHLHERITSRPLTRPEEKWPMQFCVQRDAAADVYYAEHDEKLTLNAVIWFSSHVERYFGSK